MPANANNRSAVVACVATATLAMLPSVALAEESLQQIPGMVRQTEIRIAPDTTGRLATIESEFVVGHSC